MRNNHGKIAIVLLEVVMECGKLNHAVCYWAGSACLGVDDKASVQTGLI
ncbi:hypothetical protein ACTXJ3_02100 [Brachybacterium paraconglomeratum]